MRMEIGFPGGARVDARVGDIVVRTDQPKRAGGEGSAPTPFTLFLASIGTCAGIYILGFCRQRGIDTEGIRLIQDHRIDPSTGRVENVDLEISLPAGFPREYEAALVRSAELCAVKKHLADPPQISIFTNGGEPAE